MARKKSELGNLTRKTGSAAVRNWTRSPAASEVAAWPSARSRLPMLFSRRRVAISAPAGPSAAGWRWSWRQAGPPRPNIFTSISASVGPSRSSRAFRKRSASPPASFASASTTNSIEHLLLNARTSRTTRTADPAGTHARITTARLRPDSSRPAALNRDTVVADSMFVLGADALTLNRTRRLSFCLSVILSENRVPLFRIVLQPDVEKVPSGHSGAHRRCGPGIQPS